MNNRDKYFFYVTFINWTTIQNGCSTFPVIISFSDFQSYGESFYPCQSTLGKNQLSVKNQFSVKKLDNAESKKVMIFIGDNDEGEFAVDKKN